MYLEVPMYMFNPIALGHIINHPPPNKEANIKFIDFEIPPGFFSCDLMRYCPNMHYDENYVNLY